MTHLDVATTGYGPVLDAGDEPSDLEDVLASLDDDVRRLRCGQVQEDMADTMEAAARLLRQLVYEPPMAAHLEVALEALASAQSNLMNPATEVYFRAGLLACREHVARLIEDEHPALAARVRTAWWPELGEDCGAWAQDAPALQDDGGAVQRLLVMGLGDASPTLEALPIAQRFLQNGRTPR
jgi:hypothetical protein